MKNQKLIILHGWQSSKEKWQKVAEYLNKEGEETLVPDLPGFKEETTLKTAWGLDDYLKWLEGISKDEGKFFLLGHSFGGRLAIKFAVKHPEALKGLILCGAAGIKPAKTLKIKTVESLLEKSKFFPGVAKKGLKKIYYFLMRNSDYVKASSLMRETMKKAIGEDLFPLLEKISVKTLIIWGENDKSLPLEYGKLIEQRIKNSKLIVMKGIGHGPHLQAPEELAKIILGFTAQNANNKPA